MKKFLFFTFILVLGYFIIPKDTYAYQIQAYWASDNWQVQGICQDTECLSSTGAYIQQPSYHCLTILGIEFEGNYVANHNYHNDVRITIPSSNSIAPWQNLTGQDLGWYPYGQPTNFTRETLSPASPSNPQYYPNNFLDRTYNLSYDFTPSSNITKFGYYFYFNNNNCQNIGGVRVLYYNTTDLSGPVDDNQSIINNQNKNTNDIINNQNKNTEEIKESIESIGDTLTDDTIPSNSSIENSFANIDETADSTLSGVLTAPIRFINSLTDTCQPQSFTMFHQSFDIPCGTTLFWENPNLWSDDEFIGEFPTFWNIFVGGLILYRLVLGVKRAIDDALDPQKSDTLGVDI